MSSYQDMRNNFVLVPDNNTVIYKGKDVKKLDPEFCAAILFKAVTMYDELLLRTLPEL